MKSERNFFEKVYKDKQKLSIKFSKFSLQLFFTKIQTTKYHLYLINIRMAKFCSHFFSFYCCSCWEASILDSVWITGGLFDPSETAETLLDFVPNSAGETSKGCL